VSYIVHTWAIVKAPPDPPGPRAFTILPERPDLSALPGSAAPWPEVETGGMRGEAGKSGRRPPRPDNRGDRSMTTGITGEHRRAFEALASGDDRTVAPFAVFVDGAPGNADTAVNT